MGKNQHRPVTDNDRRSIRELHAQGLGRNEISREIGRSSRTVSVLAEEMGLTFDRTATAVATEARKTDAKARRAAIVASLYDVAEDDLAYLRQGTAYGLVEVSAGRAVDYTTERLPAQDRKALVQSVGSAMTAASRLEALDTGNGVHEATSVIGQLRDGLNVLYNAMTEAEGAGDDP
ncbi:helix-turn-helix domain-containing protein [Streptomyces sp. NPDC047315]|uniref:helix-turn-helix domain-containing protein n=1 Tax=Streptomyces sp. NPDC047315 TaxID=3155142 RepID=UPI0033C92F2F